jgi:hypothetical protein
MEQKPVDKITEKTMKTEEYNKARCRLDDSFFESLQENKRSFDRSVREITDKYFKDRKELDSKLLD